MKKPQKTVKNNKFLLIGMPILALACGAGGGIGIGYALFNRISEGSASQWDFNNNDYDKYNSKATYYEGGDYTSSSFVKQYEKNAKWNIIVDTRNYINSLISYFFEEAEFEEAVYNVTFSRFDIDYSKLLVKDLALNIYLSPTEASPAQTLFLNLNIHNYQYIGCCNPDNVRGEGGETDTSHSFNPHIEENVGHYYMVPAPYYAEYGHGSHQSYYNWASSVLGGGTYDRYEVGYGFPGDEEASVYTWAPYIGSVVAKGIHRISPDVISPDYLISEIHNENDVFSTGQFSSLFWNILTDPDTYVAGSTALPNEFNDRLEKSMSTLDPKFYHIEIAGRTFDLRQIATQVKFQIIPTPLNYWCWAEVLPCFTTGVDDMQDPSLYHANISTTLVTYYPPTVGI